MIVTGQPRSRAEWLATAASVACAGVAVAALPRTELPLGWLAAWTVPAMFAGFLATPAVRPWLRGVGALLVQVTAFGLALRHAGPLSRPAILACTILPPLAYVAVRRRESDAALGLFLSFCVLLVGVILGGLQLPVIAAFAIAACLSLRCEAHLAAVAASRRPERHQEPRLVRSMLATGLLVALPCLFAALAIDRTLAWVPSPLGQRAPEATATSPANARRQGLDDAFDLGNGGLLSDLAGEQLVLVRTDDQSPVDEGLYLRSGFFQVAELDRWQPGPIGREHPPADRELILNRPEANAPIVWLEVERFAGARNFVFVPPGACALRYVPDLEIDRRREWLRQAPGAEQTDYSVAYQPLAASLDRVALPAAQQDLLALPAGLDRARYEALLAEWDVRGSPTRIAQHIAAGLASRCRYDRIDPAGQYAHAIDNFLFSDTDRRGYCMHFASAAALLLRLAGVPCRIGVGLYGGAADRREPDARIYGSQHAHAWVEIPTADRGFAVFDPTPPAERGRRTPTRSDPNETPDDAGAHTAGAGDGMWSNLLAFVLQPWFLLLVLLAAVGVQLWPGNRTAAAPQVLVPRGVKAARRQLVRILRALAEVGHLRARGQTLEQFGQVLAARQRLEPELAHAFRTYQEVRFGGYPFDETREQALQRGLAAAIATPPIGAEPEQAGYGDASDAPSTAGKA